MKILKAPHPDLNCVCGKVVGPIPIDVITGMAALLRGNEGLGLAAPQVGIRERFFLLKGTVCINPQIVEVLSEEPTLSIESCLSIPGFMLPVLRYAKLYVRFESIWGTRITQVVEGTEAIVFQHELDHLDGILITRRFAERYEFKDS